MENNKFEYNYSAPTEAERTEIERIRRQYVAPELTEKEKKLKRLRTLDSRVKNVSTAVPISLGIIGTLIFGLGLAFILEWKLWLIGVAIAIVGVIPVLLSYPVYKFIVKKFKKLYGAEILKLSDELLSEDNNN